LFVVGKDFVAAREARDQRKEKRGREREREGEGFGVFFFFKSKRRWSSRTRALEERWGGSNASTAAWASGISGDQDS
jgi:hypothetical protein